MKRKKRGLLKKMALLMFLLLVACVGYILAVNGVIPYSSKLKSFGIIKQEEHNTASYRYGWELILVNRDNYIPDYAVKKILKEFNISSECYRLHM